MCMCMCMYICVCICIYVCIYVTNLSNDNKIRLDYSSREHIPVIIY